MEAVQVQALTTVAGLASVTVIIVFIVRRALNLTGELMDRFGALIAVVVAVVLALVADVALNLTAGTDLLQAALNGLFAGLAASGGFDVLNGVSKAVKNE